MQPLAPVPDNWWRLYDDPVLDGLIADALAHNTDVRAAAARLARGRAALREVKVDRLPQGGLSAGATRGRDPGTSDTTTSFDAGLQVAYEVERQTIVQALPDGVLVSGVESITHTWRATSMSSDA